MLFTEQLLDIVSQLTGVPKEDIISPKRYRNITNAKQLYAYFLRIKFHMKLKQISAIMKNDHSSVMHSLKVINNMLSIKDESTLRYIDAINTALAQLEGLKFTQKVKLILPIKCDVDRLKSVLIEEFGCKIEFCYE